MKKIMLVAGFLLISLSSASLFAEPLDISDAAIERLLSSPFQFDYTILTDDASYYKLVNALDRELSLIEYRQMRERTATPDDSLIGQRMSSQLQERYQVLLRDGFLFKKLEQGRQNTSDNVLRQWIKQLMLRRGQMMIDPDTVERIQTLAGRIADRLFKFHFQVDGQSYSTSETVAIMETGSDRQLADKLYRQQHDSAGLLANDASRLYLLYNRIGELKGYPSSFDFSVSQLSYSRKGWDTIAEELKKITDAEYDRCLDFLKNEIDRDDLTVFNIELMLRKGTVLPDVYFTIDRADKAVAALLSETGFNHVYEKLDIITIDSAGWPAIAIKLNPPYDTRLILSKAGGFAYYRRLIAEIARTLPWIYADSTQLNMLRTYPNGTEEMFTTMFENRALDSAFLAEYFEIPQDELNRFITHNRWINIFRMRQVLMNYFFDSYLSGGRSSDPTELYWSLEKSLLGVNDSSYSWIETLISGNMNKYPKWLAFSFSRIKTEEILYRKFYSDRADKEKAEGIARFLIEEFCRPGKTQTLQEYISRNTDDPLSVADLQRQMQLK
ncbi:MAG: hypothetical protein GY841_14350 [FCB group bacterium]|nr:hypothetical protein [FCB group bacterium]